MEKLHLSGEWVSRYAYTSSGKVHTGEHIVVLQENDAALRGRSIPQDDGSVLELQLTHDTATNTLTGTWRETTSPGGYYKGAVFHGVLQLLLQEAGKEANGKWLGFNGA